MLARCGGGRQACGGQGSSAHDLGEGLVGARDETTPQPIAPLVHEHPARSQGLDAFDSLKADRLVSPLHGPYPRPTEARRSRLARLDKRDVEVPRTPGPHRPAFRARDDLHLPRGQVAPFRILDLDDGAVQHPVGAVEQLAPQGPTLVEQAPSLR